MISYQLGQGAWPVGCEHLHVFLVIQVFVKVHQSLSQVPMIKNYEQFATLFPAKTSLRTLCHSTLQLVQPANVQTAHLLKLLRAPPLNHHSHLVSSDVGTLPLLCGFQCLMGIMILNSLLTKRRKAKLWPGSADCFSRRYINFLFLFFDFLVMLTIVC